MRQPVRLSVDVNANRADSSNIPIELNVRKAADLPLATAFRQIVRFNMIFSAIDLKKGPHADLEQ